MNNPLVQAPSAGVVKRFAAMFYDAMLLFGIMFTATLIPALLLNESLPKTSNGEVVHEMHPLLTGPFFQLYLALVLISFFCLFWTKQGQTLGMQAWKLKLIDEHGQPPALSACLLRLILALASFACLGMGYWWLWIDKDGLTWHDRWSKTRVVQLTKEQQNSKK